MASSTQPQVRYSPSSTRADIFYAELDRLGISLVRNGSGGLVGNPTHSEHVQALARYRAGSILSRYSDNDLVFLLPYNDAKYMPAKNFRLCYVADNVTGEKTLLEMQGPLIQGNFEYCGKSTSEQTSVVSEKGKKATVVENEGGEAVYPFRGRSTNVPVATSAAELQQHAGPSMPAINFPLASSSIFPRTPRTAFDPEAQALFSNSRAPEMISLPHTWFSTTPNAPALRMTIQSLDTRVFNPPPPERVARFPFLTSVVPTYEHHGNESSSPPPQLVQDSGSQTPTPFSSPPTSPWLTPKSTLPSWHRKTLWHNIRPSDQPCQGCRRPALALTITLARTGTDGGRARMWCSGVVVQSTRREPTWVPVEAPVQRTICKSCLKWEEKLKIRAARRRRAHAGIGIDSSSDGSESTDENGDESGDESDVIGLPVGSDWAELDRLMGSA